MIRQDSTAPDGTPSWTLISQLEHSRIAGVLAEHWGNDGVAPVQPRDVMVTTVHRHDFGWRDWEENPDVDPEHGRPRSFIEMELADSTAIWAHSIDLLEDVGPMAQYVVGAHFVTMRKGSSSAVEPVAAEFIRRYEARCAGWQKRWQKDGPEHNTRDMLDRAVRHLQLFDMLSIWLCLAKLGQPLEIVVPDDRPLTLVRLSETDVRIEPWPFRPSNVAIEATGRQIPQKRYESLGQWASIARPVRVRWDFAPVD